MIGSDLESALEAAITGVRAPHAWLIAGPRSPAMRRFVDRAAWRIVQDSWPSENDDISDEVAAHPDIDVLIKGVHEEGPSKGKPKTVIDVGQVRQLRGRVLTRPTLGERRAAIIDSIDECNEAAANALLKILEEPPGSTTFLLIAHRPGRILPTIRSRCRLLTWRGPSAGGAAGEGALAALQEVYPSEAAAFDALDLAAVDRALCEIAAHGDPDNRLRVELAKSLTGVTNRPKLAASVMMASALLHRAARDGDACDVEPLLNAQAKLRPLIDAVAAAEDPATIAMVTSGALATIARVRRA